MACPASTLPQVEFREDLKGLYRQAGCANKATVFLFDETQIVHESFLEDVNNILSSGEVCASGVWGVVMQCDTRCGGACVGMRKRVVPPLFQTLLLSFLSLLLPF